jgi:hypothetical protein
MAPVFRRGFVVSVTLPCADFLRHAAGLFAAQPVTEVRLSDREPLWVDGGRGHGWWLDRPPGWVEDNTLPENLPAALWERLTGEVTGRWNHFPSETEAVADLSAACVAYGRALIDLPPLTAPHPEPA